MRKRLMTILAELENINYFVQQGCIDPMHLECFEESDTRNPDELMAKTDELTGVAHEAIEKLYDMMKENDQ